jgi:uncharacterized SAM-binding protein YcdF (DUF218 family)
MMNQYSSTIEAISDLLFIDTPLDTVDLIFVFGHQWIQTMSEVKSLYDKGISQKILISGHGPRKDRSESEALKFVKKGIELGIPEAAFLLEENATNTRDNIQFSIPLIEAALGFASISRILFVCKAFHARRVLMTARRFYPGHIQYLFYPVKDERAIEKGNWWQDSVAFERVMAELRRIADYALKGDISIL